MDAVEIPVWLVILMIPIVAACAAALGGYVVKSFYGLSAVQQAANNESDRVVGLQEKRIQLLEREIDQIKQDYNFLLTENRWLRQELAEVRTQQRKDSAVSVPVQVEVRPISD